MDSPLIAIVGDISSARTPELNPPLSDHPKAVKAAEQLGDALARRGARLLIYGGPYFEAEVVRGFVAANPKQDHSIVMRYSKNVVPEEFPEEKSHPKLFQRRVERGVDWETAFYRSVARADGIVLMGGGGATKISGQVAIGARIPILALQEFGGGAALVWESLTAGEDLPTRGEIDLMAKPWADDSAEACVSALYAQRERRQLIENAPRPILSIISCVLFLLALAILPATWGRNELTVWMLFIVPVLAGGAGAAIRPIVDRQRGAQGVATAVLATVVLGLVAGGVAGVLFVAAQLTAADPNLTAAEKLVPYAQRSIPFALGVGFVSGLTSDAVFGKLLNLDLVRVPKTGAAPSKD